jgi:FkbM family methyltransferase
MDTKIQQIINKLGIHKFVFFDVGASSFLEYVAKLQSMSEIYAFEPIKSEVEKLQLKYNHHSFLKLQIENFALGIENTHVDFIQTTHHSMSSLLSVDLENYEKHFGSYQNYKVWEKNVGVKKNFKVKQITLDSYCYDHLINEIDFLKLDTQGTELSVLKGAEKMLVDKKILVLKIEVSTIQIYKEQVMFSDIDLYLREKGFELVDFRTYRAGYTPIFGENAKQKHHYAPCGDAIYVAKSAFISNHQKVKTAILLLSQGYYSLASNYLKKGSLKTHEAKELLSINFDNKKDKIKLFIKNFTPPVLIHLLKKR